MKVLVLVCALVGLALPAGVRADVGNRSPLDIEFDALSSAIARGDCGEGLGEARRITERGAFKGFPEQSRGAIWTFAAVCADRKGLYDEALVDARNASEVPGATWGVWAFRLRAATKAKQLEDGPAAVEALAKASPATLDALPVSVFWQFKHDAVAAGRPELAMRIYAALEAANYAPADVSQGGADAIWLDDAGMAADAGDARHAGALIARLASTGALVHAKLDGRFAAIVAADPARFDLRAAALRQLERDRADMLTRPDRLAEVMAVASDLIGLERFDEALALDQAALDRIAKAAKGEPAFSDQEGRLAWLYESKADALTGLGRFDEALAAMRAAARTPPATGGLNVSQMLNLADLLGTLGRPAEALATLQPLGAPGAATDYGMAWVRAERVCADDQLGQANQAAADVAWLAAHRADYTGARLRALFCAGSADDVAAEFIGELKDPDQRDAALVRLSEFDPPAATTPVWAAELALLAAVRDRPDVRAAVAAVGHTERIPLCQCAYVDTF